MKTSKWITNVRVVAETGIIDQGSVCVENGRITAIVEGELVDSEGLEILDGEGKLLIPGMIDVHIHGAKGYDMMDGTVRSIEVVSETCAATGCTSFLATSVSSKMEDLLQMIDNVKQVAGKERGASIVGIHTEGPYLNIKRKGMQNEVFLRHPDITEMERVVEQSGSLLKMVTIAPELPGGMELVTYLRGRGIIVAIAHSDATYDEATEAFRLGASHITHCFNGMRPIHHRDPGLVVAAFEQPHVSLQAIVDHVHLHPAIVRLMHKIKGAEGMVLITDALHAMGLGDGDYQFGGHAVKVAGGVAQLEDGTLASSTVTMNEALRNTVELGISLEDAVTMASRTPADLLGLPQKGRIALGADADMVLLDDQFQVTWTMIDGRIYSQTS
ncbi:N-acetylglucosamine-6-phosphate deacetylase [Paenibacillus frigoriresistens]|uniref:N-acetylglucosamine-6-phosphate deacetylase n=1 Tax=Paenibacillus alginolyticus TaxID=59839 RepID=UPI001564A2E6|nr:N-acetylglucosamine-6-phosphate deacetylase [Paenibacillus frigoriresistens]NRF92400.1 N-acetylglucosamine-6-phosphate deacetylase [Paenibacillus frigoriresistens]